MITMKEREIFEQTLAIARKLEQLNNMGRKHSLKLIGNRLRLLDRKERVIWVGEGQFVLQELRNTLDRRIMQYNIEVA